MNTCLAVILAAIVLALPLDIYLLVKYDLARYFLCKIFGKKSSLERIRNKQVKVSLASGRGRSGFSKTLRRYGVNPIAAYLTPEAALFYRARLAILAGLVAGYFYGSKVGMIALVAAVVLLYEYGVMFLRSRKNKAEEQAEALVKKMVILSSQYSNVAEMFGVMYGDFDGALKIAMESCYVEYFKNGNSKEALSHFQEYFYSPVINLAIDNAVACKEDERNLEEVSTLLLSSLEAYTSECLLRREFVKGMKSRLAIALMLTLASAAICFFLLGGAHDAKYVVATTKLDVIAVLALCTYMYGINLER